MLEQINGSLGLQREMLERQNAKTVMEKEVMPSLERLTKMVEMQGARLKLVEAKEASNRAPTRDSLLPAASKWERGSGDDTPSPPRTASAARSAISLVLNWCIAQMLQIMHYNMLNISQVHI